MYKLILPVLILFSVTSFADITIIDVRKNIPLSDTDPSYTDFYLGAGKSEGLKKNLVVTVFRSMNIRDASGAQSFGEIAIPVGQVKIIAVYDKVAVAREYKLLPRDVNPMLEQVGLMSGDKIELAESFVDNSAPKRKPQAIAEETTTPATTVTTVTATSVTTSPAPQATPQTATTAPQATAQKPPTTPAPVAAAPQPLPVTPEKQVSQNVAPAASPLPKAEIKPAATVPGEVTKTAESADDEADQSQSLPGALLEDAPVNNTASPETL